ncbi:MAG: cation:proton antiporter, partial [Treponema sp.]|nr:cation:proton antiporter [Treponema sp.]
VIVIVILSVTMGMGGSGFSVPALSFLLFRILAFFVLAVVVGIFVNMLFNFMYEKSGRTRQITVFALAYCFLMAYSAEVFGLADITGAYIAGIAFCGTGCAEHLERKTGGLSHMFFTPIFLANIGFHASFGGLSGSLVLFTLALVAVSVLSKLLGCGLGARLGGFGFRESVRVGAGMIARGEVSLIVAAKGIAAGYIGSLLYPSIIVVVLVTVLITPLLLKAAFAEKKPGTEVVATDVVAESADG